MANGVDRAESLSIGVSLRSGATNTMVAAVPGGVKMMGSLTGESGGNDRCTACRTQPCAIPGASFCCAQDSARRVLRGCHLCCDHAVPTSVPTPSRNRTQPARQALRLVSAFPTDTQALGSWAGQRRGVCPCAAPHSRCHAGFPLAPASVRSGARRRGCCHTIASAVPHTQSTTRCRSRNKVSTPTPPPPTTTTKHATRFL